MIAVRLILTCAAGLAAGALARRSFHPATLAPPAGAAAETHAPADSGAATAQRAAASSTSDDRIARLFTALKEPVYLAKRYELREALRDLPASEFPPLLKRAEAVPLEMRRDLTIAVMVAWFDSDPTAAGLWMQAHPEWDLGIEAWARKDPEAAIRDALAAPGKSRSKTVLGVAIVQLAGKDPAAQIAKLRTLPAGGLRDVVFADILKKWVQTDPAAAFAAVGEMAPGATRDDARKQVVLAWANRDPAAALAQIPAMLPSLNHGVFGSTFLSDLADCIMEKNPRLALDWLSGLPGEYRSAAAIAGLGVWAQKEPVAALDWSAANGIEVARGRRSDDFSARASVLAEAMKSAPAATAAWLEARPAGPDRDSLVERALREASWFLPEEQFTAAAGILQKRLFQQLPADAQIETARDLGRRRGELSDFTDLHAWAQRFDTGPARAEAVSAAIESAYQRDASRVDALVASVAPGADRDAALRAMAMNTNHVALATAATHALGIGDSALRRATLETVVTSWLKSDSEASRAWLQDAAAIPPSWKAAWLR